MAPLTAAKANLQRLALVRAVLVVVESAAIFYGYFWLHAALPYPLLIGVVMLLAVAFGMTLWRLRQPWPVTDAEFFVQLLLDVLAHGVLLYASGGATNPFISYFLVPLTIAAAVLPWRYTIALAVISLALYTGLLFFRAAAGVRADGYASRRRYAQSARVWHVVQLRAVIGIDHVCRGAHGEHRARTAARTESAARTGAT